jgi:hypothetical protein
MKITLDYDVSRLRRVREGLVRARCWLDGYRAGGGRFLWYDSLIDAQVILDCIIREKEK